MVTFNFFSKSKKIENQKTQWSENICVLWNPLTILIRNYISRIRIKFGNIFQRLRK